MCCGIAVIGAFVVRDLRTANLETREDYVRSVHGLERIGELQYDAQETRRATLYALTTSDSNLQVQYADQSRAADKRVTDAIAVYGSHANQPAESEVAARLSRDWANYLAIRDEVLASILEGSTKEAVSLDLSGGVPAFDRVRQDLDDVKRLYDQDASQRQADLAASSRRSVSRLIGILSFTFLLSSAAVWAIQRSQMLSTIQLAKLQMEFVASVSHELRTPLAVLMSAADNLADGLVEGEAALQKYGAIVRHQSRSIGNLVDQILLFASTEDSKKQYSVEPLEVAPLMVWIVSSTEGFMKEAGATLEIHGNSEVPCILGNRTGILQCMQNLIGNAVKYGGSDRHIVLSASAVSSGNGSDAEVRISVTDHGIGIEPSELPHIFEPFYRSPRVRAAQIHGTGLGLSLAKRIAESMGGGLSVVSEQSVGSTFTLHLRIAKGVETFKEALHPSPTPL
jgi:signal transduction histidine kinase